MMEESVWRQDYEIHFLKVAQNWDFPGHLGVKTPHFQFEEHSSIPDQGTRILHASWRGQKKAKMDVSFWSLALHKQWERPDCQEQELRSWQRSWGMRLGIRKGEIEPQESPWKFSSIYPQNQSLPSFCFVLSPTPLTLRGAVPHYLSLKKRS